MMTLCRAVYTFRSRHFFSPKIAIYGEAFAGYAGSMCVAALLADRLLLFGALLTDCLPRLF